MAKSTIWSNTNRRVIVIDDNRTIKVATYVNARGVHVQISPERALALAHQLLGAALHHIYLRQHEASADAEVTQDPAL